MSPGRREARHISPVDPDSFGAQLRRFRLDAGMSQTELGEAAGLDQARISAYELGKNIPREDIITKLAEILNVPPARFFEATRFRGVLPLGESRRERMETMREQDWHLFDRFMDTLRDLTPEDRAEFDRNFAAFLSKWHGS